MLMKPAVMSVIGKVRSGPSTISVSTRDNTQRKILYTGTDRNY